MSKLPLRYRVRYACQRCAELLELQIRETQDGQDLCDFGNDNCSYPIDYDSSLPYKQQDAAVAFFLVDEWFADNDNIIEQEVRQDLVDLLRYCARCAANRNPLMKRMFQELIIDLQANDEDDDSDTVAHVKQQSRKGLH